MSKQDRQGVRTASDLERKYDLGTDYTKAIKIATDAQRSAERANNAVTELAANIGQAFIAVADVLPAASDEWWGKMVLVPNDDTDGFYVCLRVGGSYMWRRFVTESASAYLADASGTLLKTADGMYLVVNV